MRQRAHSLLDSQSGGAQLPSSEPPAAASVGGSPVLVRVSGVNDRYHRPRKRCVYCNQPFVARRYDQKYCSRECYHRSHYVHVGRIDHGFSANELAAKTEAAAQRVTPRSVEIRRVRAEDGKRYYARDADALLEEISESEQARPGLWYG